jgi:hypothetical protein
MTFPSFLGPLTPVLPLIPPITAASPIGGGAPVGGAAPNSLGFAMQTQQGSNWCWAATASSVSCFFNPASTWTQCAVADACLQNNCCAAPAPCDVTYSLDVPLSQTGNLQGTPFPGPDTTAGVQAEIKAGRPVCCHISWQGGGGHFVAISGYDAATGDVFVVDPLGTSVSLPFGTFVSSYQGSGGWDYTYNTQ